MKLFIIRHAESSNNRLAIDLSYHDYMAQRSADPPITELGERQAQVLAEHLAHAISPEHYVEGSPNGDLKSNGYRLTHLYCSAMLRTMQTAQPIAQALGLTPHLWLDIHEHGGMFLGNPRTGEGLTVYPGLTRAEIGEKFPGYVIAEGVTDAGWWQGGYEDMPGCYARATRVARELRRRAQAAHEAGEEEERIALVSHGTFIDSLLKALFNQLPSNQLFYQHYNTAITRVDFAHDGTLFLRFLNRVGHLPAEMLSQ
jgi:2,3-bisphosphoglycerate-dependent phosphoglycerate mutase